MRITRKATLALGVGSAAVAIMTTAFAGPAAADPPTGVTPAASDIVGVGSDTTQNVLNALAANYNAQSPAPARKLYSYNAFGSSTTITPKAGCPAITRPTGSGAGIAALQNSATVTSGGTTYNCIDFARSSKGPDSTTSGLSFVRFAQDAVTWSKNTKFGSNTPASLSILQLRAIYNCDASLLGNFSGPVTENEVGGTGSAAIVPVLPQSSSGTRSFFLSAIGSPGTASCVQQTSLEENNGTALEGQFTSAQLKELVSPYSVAVFLAQGNGIDSAKKGSQALGSVKNTSGTVIPPTVTDTSTNTQVINPALGTVGLTRFVYNVVRGTSIPSYLQPIFSPTNTSTTPESGGFICRTSQQATIRQYGFRVIGSQCGTIQT